MGLVEDLFARLSWSTALLIAVVGYALYSVITSIHVHVRLRRTGGGPGVKRLGWLPGSLDMIYHTVRAAMRDESHLQWAEVFRRAVRNTVEVRPLGRRVVFTIEPENIKAILATQFNEYGKGPIFHSEFEPFLGDSIFTTDGGQWHASRQRLRPQFIKDRVSDLHIFENHLQILFASMAVGGDAAATARALRDGVVSSAHGRELDMENLFFRYTLDVVTDFLLGKDTQSLTVPGEQFAEAFAEVQRVQALITRAGPGNFAIPRRSYNRGLRTLDAFINPFIEKTLLLPPDELEKTIRDDGINGRYTFLHALAQFTRDRKVLRDQLMAVLLAGRDTTAATLSWCIYELARKPACVQRLREEVARVVGVERGSGSDATGEKKTWREPTYTDLKAMKYLQHVINETLRMYPSVPFNVRMAMQDTTLPHGSGPDGKSPLAVLAHTPIGYSTLLMQRRPDLYPPTDPHPDVFCPERWDTWQPRPWQYVPFNGGPRICIGQQFALTEMGYVLVRLFQRFERLETRMDAIDGGKATLRSNIVLMPGDGVKVVFYEH